MIRKLLLAGFVAGALVACSSTPKDNSQLNAKIQGLVSTAENAASVYMGASTVDHAVKAKVQAAEAVLDALVASLPAMTPANAQDSVNQIIASVNAVVAALPPEIATDKLKADVAAAELLVQGLVVAFVN